MCSLSHMHVLEDKRSPGAEFTGGCEPQDTGTGNQTQDLWKNSVGSLLFSLLSSRLSMFLFILFYHHSHIIPQHKDPSTPSSRQTYLEIKYFGSSEVLSHQEASSVRSSCKADTSPRDNPLTPLSWQGSFKASQVEKMVRGSGALKQKENRSCHFRHETCGPAFCLYIRNKNAFPIVGTFWKKRKEIMCKAPEKLTTYWYLTLLVEGAHKTLKGWIPKKYTFQKSISFEAHQSIILGRK